jgi:hypothetical protein
MSSDEEKKLNNTGGKFSRLNWAGAVALILATGVSLSMIMAMAATMMKDRPLGEFGATVLSTLFGATLGALATYLGQAARSNGDNK